MLGDGYTQGYPVYFFVTPYKANISKFNISEQIKKEKANTICWK